MARRDKPVDVEKRADDTGTDDLARVVSDAVAQGIDAAMTSAADAATVARAPAPVMGGADLDAAAPTQDPQADARAPDPKAGMDAARADVDELGKSIKQIDESQPKVLMILGEHEDYGDID